MCFGSKSPSYPAPLPKPAAVPETVPVKDAPTTDTSTQPSTSVPTVPRQTAATTGLAIPSV